MSSDPVDQSIVQQLREAFDRVDADIVCVYLCGTAILLASSCPDQCTGPLLPACATTVGELGRQQGLAPARMRQHKVVIPQDQHELLLHARLALAQRVAPTAHGRHKRARVQGQPFHKSRLDLLATRQKDLRPPLPCPQDSVDGLQRQKKPLRPIT